MDKKFILDWVEMLAGLEADWDGDDAVPIPLETITSITAVVDQLPDDLMQPRPSFDSSAFVSLIWAVKAGKEIGWADVTFWPQGKVTSMCLLYGEGILRLNLPISEFGSNHIDQLIVAVRAISTVDALSNAFTSHR